MKKSAKYGAVALLLAVAFVGMPSVSSAQSVTDLQAQLNMLMQQVQQLQARLTQIQGAVTQTWCHTFGANLGIGSSGDDVIALVKVLQKEGFQVSDEDDEFDESIASAVTGLQEKYEDDILVPLGLEHGTGYIGKATGAKLNALYGCATKLPPPPLPSPSPSPSPVPVPAPICTQDIKQCPDGSYVSRTGPNCEFAACPVPTPTPTPFGCLGVQTSATDPATGQCKTFSTPCDVPSGWNKVASCPIPLPSPTPTLQVALSASPTSGAAPLNVAFSAGLLSPAGYYSIVYGDGANSGSLQTPPCLAPGGCTSTANHTYATAGTYTATLYSTNPMSACPPLIGASFSLCGSSPLATVTITVGGQSRSSLIVTRNPALSDQTVARGTISQRIGSYLFSLPPTASPAEGVSVSAVSIQANGNFFQNLKLMVNSAQFGVTQAIVSSGTIYTFSDLPFGVSAYGTIALDVYADILTSASSSVSPATILTGCSATGQVSLTQISCSPVNGQSVSIASPAAIVVTADQAQVPTGQIVMGSTGNPLAIFRLTEISNIENVRITTMNVVDSVASTATVKSSFANLQLYNGPTLVGTPVPAVPSISGQAYLYTFYFAMPVVVPQASAISLTLKGDVPPFVSSAATDNSQHTFKVATTTDPSNNTSTLTVVAIGATSVVPPTVTLSSAWGNPQTVLRSKLTFAATPLGAPTGRGKVPTDPLATLSFSASPSGPIVVNTVTVTFSGTAPSSTNFLGGVSLRDENNYSLGMITTSSPCTGGSSLCSVTFSLGATSTGQIVLGGVTRNWTLVVDSTKTQPATGSSSVNLVATINSLTDIQFTDALDAAAVSGLTMPPSVLTPINLNSVVYQQGT